MNQKELIQKITELGAEPPAGTPPEAIRYCKFMNAWGKLLDIFQALQAVESQQLKRTTARGMRSLEWHATLGGGPNTATSVKPRKRIFSSPRNHKL